MPEVLDKKGFFLSGDLHLNVYEKYQLYQPDLQSIRFQTNKTYSLWLC